MIPVDQAHIDDCTRAAIASVLELELNQVPDFYRDAGDDNFWPYIMRWLNDHGIAWVEFNPKMAPRCYYLAWGPPPGHTQPHMVVMFGKEIVHDPSNTQYDKAARGNPMRRGVVVRKKAVLVPVDVGTWFTNLPIGKP